MVLVSFGIKISNNNLLNDKPNETKTPIEKPIEKPIDNNNEANNPIIEHPDNAEKPIINDEIEINFIEQSVYFSPNNYELDANALTTIDEIANILKNNTKKVIQIEGHVNGYPEFQDGSFAHYLSSMRAYVVKQALLERGIDSSKIISYGIGSSMNIDNDGSEIGKQSNRRAIILLK
jgi:outer membrane protein OmpA-like peptidoglycan-associated protein